MSTYSIGDTVRLEASDNFPSELFSRVCLGHSTVKILVQRTDEIRNIRNYVRYKV